MPRGVTPIRVRRRQSDAKWRASVAMCYNIMKNVIPNQKMLGRRKVSKALTLKETERHIINLERKLRDLMEEKAPCSGKAVMISDEDGNIRCATFEDIKRDFAIKQVSFFSSDTGSGKKRYNIPADIEASLLNLSKQTCQLFVVNRAESKVPLPPAVPPRRPLADKGQVVKKELVQFEERANSTPSKNFSHSLSNTPRMTGLLQQSRASNTSLTPLKKPGTNMTFTPQSSCIMTARARPSGKLAAALTSPGFESQMVPSQGFTPVKLPVDYDQGDPLFALHDTPVKSFGSPFSFFSPIADDNPDLLCTETIDPLDMEIEHLGLTPTLEVVVNQLGSSKVKIEHSSPEDRPKCRRRLDVIIEIHVGKRVWDTNYEIGQHSNHMRSYNGKGEDQTVPDCDQTSKLDSFLMHYNPNSNSSDETHSIDSNNSVTMPKMFDSHAAVKGIQSTSLGCLDDSVGLSSDLVLIDLDPFSKTGKKKFQCQVQDETLKDSQQVPDLTFGLPSQLCSISNDFDLVPEYADLGILYNKDCKEELFSFDLGTEGEIEDGSDNLQVVPSF